MGVPAVRSSRPAERWNPFAEFEELHGQLDRLLRSTVASPDAGWRGWAPPVDVSETDDAYVVEAELPGVAREDIDVDLTGRELTITGERKEVERRGWFRHRSRRVGKFHYAVTLPHEVDADRIEATLADGVLTVRAPKATTARSRRITVSGG